MGFFEGGVGQPLKELHPGQGPIDPELLKCRVVAFGAVEGEGAGRFDRRGVVDQEPETKRTIFRASQPFVLGALDRSRLDEFTSQPTPSAATADEQK